MLIVLSKHFTHFSEIIPYALLSIQQQSEEAEKARNGDFTEHLSQNCTKIYSKL